MNLIVHTDGGSRGNPGPAALGFVIQDNNGREIFKQGKYLGILTNNQAEYAAVIAALKWISGYLNRVSNDVVTNTITFIMDSELLVNQLNGNYRIKSTKLQPLAIEVKNLESALKEVIHYQYVSRNNNRQADKLVNIALDEQEN